MICPLCNEELPEKVFQIPYEVPYLNIIVCRHHVTDLGYEKFLDENAEKLIETYNKGKIKQENKQKK